jgi:hypothetical protein
MEPFLIIAFELAILSFIFWYMFLRGQKRPEVKRGLWGKYPEAKQNALTLGQPSGQFTGAQDSQSLYSTTEKETLSR